MQKDFTRDYAVEMLRLYARLGKPTYENLKKRMAEDNSIEYSKAEPLLLDIKAVDNAMRILERKNKSYVIAAVEAVYFACPNAPLRRNDVSYRVHRFSLSYPSSESAVWAWLKEARLLCAEQRGLRTLHASLE